MSHLSLRLLGPFQVTLGPQPVSAFKSDKVRALLAYLAVESQRPHPRKSLAGLLWPDIPERSARASLRDALANLRQVIGDHEAEPPFLHISRQTIQFNHASDTWVDANVFNDLLARRVLEPSGIRRLEEALDLYQGSFLDGFSVPDSPPFEEWALLMRARLQRLVIEALYQATDMRLARGEVDHALLHARRLLALDPLMEAAHRQVMRCLASNDQRSAAIAQFEECRRVLGAELGVEPSAETRALLERIRVDEVTAPTKVATTAPKNNLPPQNTPFVRRETVLAEINALLEDQTCRLLTLVGPGGSGKTRLALEAAERQLDAGAYPDGAFFVSLAPLDAVEAIAPTVADALGLSFHAEMREGASVDPQQQLLDYLCGKNLLLVMDNYEHLLTPPPTPGERGTPVLRGGEAIVTEILNAAPGVKVLATSRARLNVGGEHRFPVGGMDYPRPDTAFEKRIQAPRYSAIQLFLQGAHRARPGFELTDDNISAVLEICHLVQGMPLAIRLAAAWVDSLTPTEIATEIARSLDLLETERRDVPARQQGMRATFDHSWRLLTEKERKVLARGSVFRGGFTREAGEAIIGASARELRALVNKSICSSSRAAERAGCVPLCGGRGISSRRRDTISTSCCANMHKKSWKRRSPLRTRSTTAIATTMCPPSSGSGWKRKAPGRERRSRSCEPIGRTSAGPGDGR